jgi:hypothetical protein
MAYDGMYSDLSTRGTTNEILSQVLEVRDQVSASETNVENLAAQAASDAALASGASATASVAASNASSSAASSLSSKIDSEAAAVIAQQAAADAITNSAAALVVANTANTTANTALTNANNAVTTANGIAGTANTALTNSNNAVTTANTALTNSNNAVTTANGIAATANTALTNSNTAITTANAAQPGDATLTALAGLVTSANKMIYSTGVDAFSLTDLSAYMRTVLDDTSAAAARTTLGVLNVDPGYIQGLEMLWVSATAFTVSTGSAYVPGLSKVVTLSSASNITGFTGAANTFFYVYLTEITGTPTIEFSTTVPVIATGTSYTKTGDTTRRLVGQVLTGAANTILKFKHISSEGRIRYYAGNWAVAPFALVIGGTTTTSVTVTATVVAPATATSLHCGVAKFTAGTWIAGNADLGALSTTNYLHTTDQSQGIEIWIELSRITSPQTFTYLVGAGSVNILAYGYKFDR